MATLCCYCNLNHDVVSYLVVLLPKPNCYHLMLSKLIFNVVMLLCYIVVLRHCVTSLCYVIVLQRCFNQNCAFFSNFIHVLFRVPTPFPGSNSSTFQAFSRCSFKLFQHLTTVVNYAVKLHVYNLVLP